MAKDPKRPAGGFEAENTGGLLSGFLAEEHQFDRRALWRVGSWGVAAVSAVSIAVMSNQSSIALRRDEVAAVDLTRQAQQLQSAARESQNEIRRLMSAVDTLNTDRDRLYSRITVLEQGLDSATGTIARQNPGLAPVQAAPAPAAVAAPDPQAWLQNLAPAAVPAPSPVTTATVKPAEKPSVEAKEAAKATDRPTSEAVIPAPAANVIATVPVKPADKPITEPKAAAKAAAKPITEAKALEKPEAKAAEKPDPAAHEKAPVTVSSLGPPALTAPPASPLMAPKSMMGPPDPAAGKLLEPAKPVITAAPKLKPEANAAPSADEAEAEESETANANVAGVQRTEFGVDVGSANSIAGLRALWRGLLKSRSNAALTTLRPIIVVKEGSNGLGMQLRLVAGPLGDAAAAAKICAGMSENNRPCEPTVFEGQRLPIKAEDTDAKSPTVKPVVHKRSYPKHVTTAPEEPIKPEPPASTMSTLFGKR